MFKPGNGKFPFDNCERKKYGEEILASPPPHCLGLQKPGEKSETLETGCRVSLEGFGCCCTPRKCTDEVIADVSLQNPKALKISKISPGAFGRWRSKIWKIPNKHVLSPLALLSVNIENPGSSIEQSRTDKHDKLLWFYRCSFQGDPKKSISSSSRALCHQQQPTF